MRDSGLMYKILTAGTGDSPAAYDEVLLNYEGRLVNGTVFDSTYTRNQPVSLVVQGTIPGMIEALQSMHPGDHWEVLIPPDLAYGSRGVGPVPPNSALIFDLELLEINHPEDDAATAPADDAGQGAPNAS